MPTDRSGPWSPRVRGDPTMVILGIDAHKRTHTVVAVDERSRKLGQRTVGTTTADHLELLVWASRFGAQRCWAVEDCRHLSRRLERDLLGAGQQVVRVPPKLMAHARTAGRTYGWQVGPDRCAGGGAGGAAGARPAHCPAGRPPPGAPAAGRPPQATWSPTGPASSTGCAGTCMSWTPHGTPPARSLSRAPATHLPPARRSSAAWTAWWPGSPASSS